MIEFTLPLLAVTKARPRVGRNGHAYTPKKSANFERDFALASRPHMPRKPFAGPVRVELRFGLPGKGEPSTPHTAHRGDVDNFAKAILDALNGHAWIDDRQIFDMRAIKLWAREPSIHIKIEEVATT